MSANVSTYSPASILLDTQSTVLRAVPNHRIQIDPERLLAPDELEEFDSHTIWYDVAIAPRGDRLHAIGPPLENLQGHLMPVECHIIGEDGRRSVRLHPRIRHRPRATIMTLPLPRRCRSANEHQLRMTFANGTERDVIARRPPVRNSSGLTLTTLQKDNPLPWIRLWCQYWRWQGVDQIIIYDNGSTSYSISELRRALSTLEDLQVTLVEWAFPYGPSRSFDLGYAQAGSLNHARLFHRSAWTASFDVDEYPVSSDGSTVADQLGRTPIWCAEMRLRPFNVKNSTSRRPTDASNLSPADFIVRELSPGTTTKYVYRTRRARWCTVHWAEGIVGTSALMEPSDRAYFHFAGLNTGWKHEHILQPVEMDTALHVNDPRVRDAFLAQSID